MKSVLQKDLSQFILNVNMKKTDVLYSKKICNTIESLNSKDYAFYENVKRNFE